jgi:protein-L-isoaspartate(D-aspartate) O-methyltransferase
MSPVLFLACVGFPLLQAGCSSPADAVISAPQEDPWEGQRRSMVSEQLRAREIVDSRVLEAMGKVPRHLFVPVLWREHAYEDSALPIDRGQTISQPYIVALMTQLAAVEPGDAVLEIGTGSGYQAAVLAEITDRVYSIEIDAELASIARTNLDTCGYERVTTLCGDGYAGWPEYAPFDAILVTAAAPRVPEPLKQQLKQGGVLIIPVGEEGGIQRLTTITRTQGGYEETIVELVRFVPMTGEVQKPQ